MKNIDLQVARHVARLARLKLSDSELESLAEDMSSVLSHFADLEKVETAASGRLADSDSSVRLRHDEPRSGSIAEVARTLAPQVRDGFFLVPRLEALGARETPE